MFPEPPKKKRFIQRIAQCITAIVVVYCLLCVGLLVCGGWGEMFDLSSWVVTTIRHKSIVCGVTQLNYVSYLFYYFSFSFSATDSWSDRWPQPGRAWTQPFITTSPGWTSPVATTVTAPNTTGQCFVIREYYT